MKAANVAKRNNATLRELKKLFRLQPGILDADIEKDGRILLQLVTCGDKELLKMRDEAIEQVCGSQPKYVATTSNRLRPDQFRLLGAAFALPLLLVIIFLELIGIEGWIPAAIAIPGIIVSSYQMFREAIASIVNRQLGFQVLTSLAVIGACGLMMWEEALIVAILVALTAHLEGDALMKAREACRVDSTDCHGLLDAFLKRNRSYHPLFKSEVRLRHRFPWRQQVDTPIRNQSKYPSTFFPLEISSKYEVVNLFQPMVVSLMDGAL